MATWGGGATSATHFPTHRPSRLNCGIILLALRPSSRYVSHSRSLPNLSAIFAAFDATPYTYSGSFDLAFLSMFRTTRNAVSLTPASMAFFKSNSRRDTSSTRSQYSSVPGRT